MSLFLLLWGSTIMDISALARRMMQHPPHWAKLRQEAFYRRYNGIDDEYWSAEKAWFLLKNCAMVWPASGEKEYSEKCQITILVSEKRCCSNRLSGSVSNNYPGYMWGASWL